MFNHQFLISAFAGGGNDDDVESLGLSLHIVEVTEELQRRVTLCSSMSRPLGVAPGPSRGGTECDDDVVVAQAKPAVVTRGKRARGATLAAQQADAKKAKLEAQAALEKR